jgi:hypothetical protein
VRLATRAELRTGRLGLLGLGVLLGLVGGIVLASVAVAERTGTAYTRLVAAVGLDDARVVVPAGRPAVLEALPSLPGVTRSWVANAWVARVDGPAVRYLSVLAGPNRPEGLVQPVVIAGHAPTDDAGDEVLVAEPVAAELGLRPGDVMTLRLLTAKEIGQFDVGLDDPDGSVARVRVTGIARAPVWGPTSSVIATPRFSRLHAAEVGVRVGFVRLADTRPAARKAFADAVTRVHLTAAGNDPSGSPRPEPYFPTSEADRSLLTARTVLVGGLAVFAVVLGLGGLLVVGQGMLRHHAARTDSHRIEIALGLTRGERFAARVAAGLLGAVVAGLIGTAIILAAGVLEPLGSQARFEPTPGFRPPWTIAVVGGIGLAVTFAVLTAGAALVAVRDPDRTALRAWEAVPARIGRRPVLLAGLGLAWRSGGLRTAATVAGLTVSIAGVVATAAFGASLQRLADTPARYGAAADMSLVDAREADVDALVADPRVAALDAVSSVSVALGTETAPRTVVAIEHRKGELPVEVVAGEPPSGRYEIALGPRAADRLGVGVGDFLTVTPIGATPTVLLVTGIVVVQAGGQGSLGEVGLVTPLQLRDLAFSEPVVSAEIRAAPGQAESLIAELSPRLEVYRTGVPNEVRNLAEVLSLPMLLALVLAAVAVAGLVHAVLAIGRRHRRDLAVLAVLGATPWQVRATLAVAAAATVVPAVVVGLPLGLGLARVLWWQTATGIGVAGDLDVPVGLLLAVGPLMVLSALLASVVPATRTSRVPPAAVLAGE